MKRSQGQNENTNYVMLFSILVGHLVELPAISFNDNK